MGCSTEWPLWVPRGSVSAAAVVAAAPRPGCQCKAEVPLAAVPSLMHAGRHPVASRACLPFICLQVCAPRGPYGTAGPARRRSAVPAAQVRSWGPAHGFVAAQVLCITHMQGPCGLDMVAVWAMFLHLVCLRRSCPTALPPILCAPAASAGMCSTWAPMVFRCGSSPWCRCSTTCWEQTARCVEQPENIVLHNLLPECCAWCLACM